jgi:hypothetical protein
MALSWPCVCAIRSCADGAGKAMRGGRLACRAAQERLRYRQTRSIPAQLLRSLAVARRYPCAGVQREPVHLHAQQAPSSRLPPTIATDATIPLWPALSPSRCATLDRRGRKDRTATRSSGPRSSQAAAPTVAGALQDPGIVEVLLRLGLV